MAIDDDDMAELAQVFLEEGREHLEQLAISLVAIEADAGDDHAMREAFRAAHSLKGMAASMGHERIVRLTHSLEDLLDALRTPGSPAPTSDLVTAMLEASDRLGRLVEDIASVGHERADVSDVEDTMDAARAAWMQDAVTDTSDDAGGPDPAALEQALAAGLVVWQVEVEVSERSLLPGARAWAALGALSGAADLLGSVPTMDELEAGTVEARTVVAWLAAPPGIEAGDIQAVAQGREVTSVAAAPWSATATPAPSAPDVDAAEAGEGAGEGAGERPTPAQGGGESRPSLRKAQTVRVDAGRLDELMHGVEELLVRRSRLQTLALGIGRRDLSDAIDALDRAARELQGLVMDVRMVSIDSVLRMVPRMTRDLASHLGKEVRVEIAGRDTELDRTVVDVLADPLVHLVRNSIDHGIESPEERIAAGKPRSGTLSIVASTESGSIWIRVADDGRGLDPAKIRQRAVERGLLDEARAAALDDTDVLELCFEPGFSTRATVGEVSGRGVGLDVVRSSVRSLGGDVLVESAGTGTVMTIRLPLTLAIRSVLLVRVGADTYAFHTDRVGQTIDLELQEVMDVAGHPQIVHLGTPVPLAWLGACIEEEGYACDRTRGHVVLLEGPGSEALGIVVDEVVGQVEVVTRALPSAVGASSLLSASAVLGGGDVAFLIDADALASVAIGEGTPHVTA